MNKKKVNNKPKPITNPKCQFCGVPAKSVLMIELREKPGPPLKDNDVLYFICEEHTNLPFDSYVSHSQFQYICDNYKTNYGLVIDKRYCTVRSVELKKK